MNTVVTAHVYIPSQRDRMGDEVGTPDEYDIENVWVGRESSSEENNEYRESTVSNTTLWVPSGAPDIPNTATITFNDSAWVVDGKAGSSVHPMTGFNFKRKPVPVREA